MDRILPAQRDWPLHDVAGSRAIEQASQAELPPHTLMKRAGAAVADLARALHPHAQRVWIACGPGNNGGDGLDAAIHLRAAGLDVEVTLAADSRRLPADAADAFARAQAAGVAIKPIDHTPATPDVAIDALLGLGAQRPPEGAIRELVERLNRLRCPVLAVDLPSGLNPDTGQPRGEACVAADHTLSLLTLKPGLFTGAGRDLAGEVWLDSLGTVGPQPARAQLTGSACLHLSRRHAQHKGSFGDLAVVAGAPGMTGAAWLAARAAHAAGAGRVYVSLLEDDVTIALDGSRPELMVRPHWWQSTSSETLSRATVVAGCGGGTAIRQALPRLLSAAGRLVLDADALNAMAADGTLAQLLTARKDRNRETVLTPHPLEAARLLGISTSDVQADRLAAAAALAAKLRCVVVLKGSGSVTATPEGGLWINGSGTAALASAGTGDVLAGWIAGVWSASGASAAEVARHAVWVHGLAGERSASAPVRAAELIDAMHRLSAQG